MLLLKEVDSFQKHYDEIKLFANEIDLVKGSNFPNYYVNYIKSYNQLMNDKNVSNHLFWIRDFYNRFYDYHITIKIVNNTLLNCVCDCDQFVKENKCYHVVAVLKNYANKLFKDSYDTNLLFTDFLDRQYKLNNKKNNVKKEVNLDVQINIDVVVEEDGYYYYDRDVKALIGEKKMYSLFNHPNFFMCYNNSDGECRFGKDFTFNSDTNFFSKKNERLIYELEDYYLNYKNGRNKALGRLLDFLCNNNYSFTINGHVIESVIEGSPLVSEIKKCNDDYELSFNYTDLFPLLDNFNYVYYNGNVYSLNTNERNLLEDIYDNGLDKVVIKKDNFNAFSNGLLRVIKNNIIVDDSASEYIKISKLNNVELYFDLGKKSITCNILFDYNGEKINYFDDVGIIPRDDDKENEVVNELIGYGFEFKKNLIELEDINQEVYFIENGLELLAEKYSIFTTEKFKNIKISKKTSITSSFGIGKDNIFSYDFNLDNISSDELVNIFKDMRAKKKYFRLKNGDILNLDDNNLRELEDLTDELNFTDEEIINGRGKIQKYRAIYLDSLRKGKYKNIQTNNLFDEFINNFYEYRDTNLSISDSELRVLRDYQIVGVKWLYNVYKTGFGGILADEMGLGKTIQTIYYIKQILKDNCDAKVLIVVPTSLVYNWKHEFDMYGNEIKVNIVSGNKMVRENLLNLDASVYITSYGQLREDEELYKLKNFHSMFIDEAQSIKNHGAAISKVVKGISAETKFALTGTPLENSPLELWSIFDYIMPGFLGNIDKFRNKYKINDFNDNTDKLLDGLNKQITPFILRRKKVDVTKELPEKIENNIYVELTDKQKKIYVAELEKTKKLIDDLIKNGNGGKLAFLIFPLLTKLRQICIDPKIIYENYDGGSNKIESLIYIIKENLMNNNKILMFTSFKEAMNIVANRLQEEDIPFYTISGDVGSKERMMRVNEFNDRSSAAVFLIMLKAGGTGLNLASASTVIHLDLWWNPQAENQATDRAHRIGQKKNVEVVHIITKGTIEEKILELQKKKLKLSDKLIDGEIRDKDIISTLSENDIKELFAGENNE